MGTSFRQSIHDLLAALPTQRLDALKKLFWSELNYERANAPLSTRGWTDGTAESLADTPLLFATAGEGFHVIYCRLNGALNLTTERQVVGKLLAEHPYGLFIFSDAGQTRWHFVNVKYTSTPSPLTPLPRGEGSRRRLFRRITITPYELLRTAAERIALLDVEMAPHDLFGVSPTAIQALHDEAFDVEKVTKKFFEIYRRIFEQAEASIKLDWTAEQKRLYTQKFFNRLMFLAFLERKGWMSFGGRRDYLRTLFEDYYHNDPEKRVEANFHRKRLNTLFFWGLNNPRERDERDKPEYKLLRSQVGDVPYLNGGLFEQEEDDETWFFPDAVVAKILTELVYAFNFTVTESTPLDVEVAVDPEMLGKIFEELVTGRHETGSYYTPKPVVAFMCRESLKGYLETALPIETPDAIARFVDGNQGEALRDPETALEALKRIKVCDPACGSGAYLLGMLHELLEQRACLFTACQLDPKTVYERKLEIIQNSLYGVDIDPFAVNIARLRLWLSLIVDFEGETPPPLPNLNYKIETGDSLTAPDPSGGLQPDLFRYGQVQEYLRLKNEYMIMHEGVQKKHALDEKIQKLRKEIADWAHPSGGEGLDWAVEFAEVFMPELADTTLTGAMAGVVNAAGGQMELTPEAREGGFDVVLANPPYVRQELISDIKPTLKRVYKDLFTGTADLYVYFYLRAQQLLRPGGAACFISSNKWLRAGYGETLRQHLLDEQTFTLVVDFGELPVFQTAATFPAIFVWRKEKRGETPTKWAVVKNLQECYDEGITEHITRIAHTLPATQFGKGKPRLAASTSANLRSKMEKSGKRLGEILRDRMFNGVKTGLNDAFVVNKAVRDDLIAQDPKSAELIKPFLIGDDIRRYELSFREFYLLYIQWDTKIKNYPAIHNWLSQWRGELEKRDGVKDDGLCPWYALSRPRPEGSKSFGEPKILYPLIALESRFVLDTVGLWTNNSIYFVASGDWYLLGLLNSSTVWEYLKLVCAVLGDENTRGRLQLTTSALETLPIPDAPQNEREEVARLAQEAQNLHTQRRRRVEQFLRAIGTNPAQSTSRNPLEAPWVLNKEDFTRRAKSTPQAVYMSAREETSALTEEIVKIEAEIDERVKLLYGVG